MDEPSITSATSAQASGAERNDERRESDSDDSTRPSSPSAIWQINSQGNDNNNPLPFANPANLPTSITSDTDNDQPFDPFTTPYHRTSSPSSSLFELVGDRNEDVDEAWHSLGDDDIAGAREEAAASRSSQAYFGSGYIPRNQHIPRDPKSFHTATPRCGPIKAAAVLSGDGPAVAAPEMASEDQYHDDDWQQAGKNADAQDLAGPGLHGRIDCSVGEPRRENEATQNQFISYLVTTNVSLRLPITVPALP